MEEYVKKNLISTNTASEIFYTHMNVSLNMKKKTWNNLCNKYYFLKLYNNRKDSNKRDQI
jgi:hypothetical protein